MVLFLFLLLLYSPSTHSRLFMAPLPFGLARRLTLLATHTHGQVWQHTPARHPPALCKETETAIHSLPEQHCSRVCANNNNTAHLRGNNNEDLSYCVSKVVFTLHHTFAEPVRGTVARLSAPAQLSVVLHSLSMWRLRLQRS